MKSPLFSIITCTKNSAIFLADCLASIEQQSDTDFEHIIIDGNSTDKTGRIIREYTQRKHAYTIKVERANPRGIANAMNHGINLAKGKYIYFLNSDDSLYSRDVLHKVHLYLATHPEFDWVYGNIHENDGDITIGFPPKRKIFQAKHLNILKYYNYIPHQATFIKKGVFKTFGLFDENLRTMMDTEYWLRIAPRTRWTYFPHIIANYLIRSDSQSENHAHRNSNTVEFQEVQSRYLNPSEMIIAKLINKLIR